MTEDVDCADAGTVERIYAKTGRAALSKALYVVGRADVAEEVVQETFLRLWHKRPRFPDEKAAFYWIYKTCHNLAVDHLRSAVTRRESPVEGELFSSLEDAVNHADLSLKRQFIGHLLAGLSEREAGILVYRVIDGMTQEEIAELLGVSRKTVVRDTAVIESKLARLKEKGDV